MEVAIMKRILCAAFSFLIVVSLLPTHVFAGSCIETNSTVYNEDRGYFVEEIIVIPSRASHSTTGSKVSTYYTETGTAVWKVTVTGSFTYNGTTASCTSSSCTVTILNSSWYQISKSSGRNGASATASATLGYKMNGVKVNEITRSVKLTCDKNGNLT